MGAFESLQGWFIHDMDLDSSILVSSRGYIGIDQSIKFQWGSFVHSDGLLILVSFWKHSFWFDMSLPQTKTEILGSWVGCNILAGLLLDWQILVSLFSNL